jgi:hypothetical protein
MNIAQWLSSRYIRPGVDLWLEQLCFVGIAHGGDLLRSMLIAAHGKYAVSPVDADMVLESLLNAGLVEKVGKPTPGFSQKAWHEYGGKHKGLLSPASHYAYRLADHLREV